MKKENNEDDQSLVPGNKSEDNEAISESLNAESSSYGSSSGAASIPPAFMIVPGDDQVLEKYFGSTLKNEIINLHDKILAKPGAKPAVFGALFTEPITDKIARGRIHNDMRRIFAGHFETEMTSDGTIKITASPPIKSRQGGHQRYQNPRPQNNYNQLKGKVGWEQLGGQYLHFSLYKENKDTMEVISFLARALHTKPRDFAFAGTKDRRAVTVQRVSVYRKHPSDLARLNRELRSARVGDFKYEKQQLELGENQGNQFIITLRDCHFGEDGALDYVNRSDVGRDVVGKAVKHLKDHGFINYYGLQRFGTFGIGTDEIGKKILNNDFHGAVEAILSYSEESLEVALNSQSRPSDRISRDDLDRAYAINLFKLGNVHKAVEILPNKFSGEKAILQHLSLRQKETDYLGALISVNRNLRTMYVHAYQSLVWNTVASQRWARHGNKVVKGDLVLVENPAEKAVAEQVEVDESGEIVVRPAADDFAVTHDDIYQRARLLTAEEADSGNYSIFDIVLPTPGFDVEYPDNDIGDYYKEFMGSVRGGGIDPGDMRRKQKDFSLSGNYRKLIGQVHKDASFEIKTYTDENEQLVETDLEKLNKSRPQQSHIPYQANSTWKQDNWQNNNSGSRGRDDRNNHGRRGGRQNEKFGRQRRDINEPPPAEPNPKLSAWMNLPEKLAAEDKARAEAVELAKLTEKPINPDDIKQPIYKQTFIETSAHNEGRRTGRRVTIFVGADGQVTKEEAEAQIAENCKDEATNVAKDTAPTAKDDAPAVEESFPAIEEVSPTIDASSVGELMDIDAVSATQSIDIPEVTFRDSHASGNLPSSLIPSVPLLASSSSSNSSGSGGGVKLYPEDTPKKWAAEKISTSVSSPLNPAVAEFKVPAHKEKVAKKKLSVGAASNAASNASSSPRLDPAAVEFVTPASDFHNVKPTVAVDNTVPESDLVTGDLDLASKKPEVKIAVIIKFALGTSQYATIALRELMKYGGVKTYKPDFSSGR